MRTRHLFIGMLAIAAAVACKPEHTPVEAPKLDVDKTEVSVAATAGEASFSVTSNKDWTASADADWVSVDPSTGKASDKASSVKVTAEDNGTEEARTATVTVKAGNLTKTVKVTQAAGQNDEKPEPKPEPETYFLVGDAVGGWNFDNPVVLTLTDGYYVAKEVSIAGEKDMHFTKTSSWEGNVKGLHGRIAPNEIGEVGNNNISLTAGGSYDVYLAEALDKFYFMTPGILPSEAVEHVEIATVWGVCGAIEGNSWGASTDPVLEQEGDWFVARNIAFTEVNFKVRGNNTWADDLKWGTAVPDQKCGFNEAIAVSTCTDYIAAYGGGDNPNIYVDGGAGSYDIYFSPDKKEVWVMTPGYKPGETPAGPDTPEPAVKETIWEGDPFDLGSDWSQGLQITSVPRLPEDARIHVVYEAPAGYDYYQFKFCCIGQDWSWNALTSPPGATDGCVLLDASATEYSFALNAEDLAAINSGRGMVIQGYAAIIKKVYFTSDIEVGDGPKLIWEGRCELLSDWSTSLQIQNMPLLESGMSIYVEYEAAGYDYYQVKFCYIDENWGWNVMTSPTDVNEYDCVMLDSAKTEYVLALNDDDIAAINAGKGMVIQGYGAVITKVSYK